MLLLLPFSTLTQKCPFFKTLKRGKRAFVFAGFTRLEWVPYVLGFHIDLGALLTVAESGFGCDCESESMTKLTFFFFFNNLFKCYHEN